MTVREHLSKFHAAAHEHHSAAAQFHDKQTAHHSRLARLFREMSKAAGAPDGETYSALADEHDGIAKVHKEFGKAHDSYAQFHAASADECAKAANDALNKLVPTRVSAIPTRDAPPEAFGMNARAVMRPGQRELVDKANVPPEFQHLVEVSESLDDF